MFQISINMFIQLTYSYTDTFRNSKKAMRISCHFFKITRILYNPSTNIQIVGFTYKMPRFRKGHFLSLEFEAYNIDIRAGNN